MPSYRQRLWCRLELQLEVQMSALIEHEIHRTKSPIIIMKRVALIESLIESLYWKSVLWIFYASSVKILHTIWKVPLIIWSSYDPHADCTFVKFVRLPSLSIWPDCRATFSEQLALIVPFFTGSYAPVCPPASSRRTLFLLLNGVCAAEQAKRDCPSKIRRRIQREREDRRSQMTKDGNGWRDIRQPS